jgi:hypothetical protein
MPEPPRNPTPAPVTPSPIPSPSPPPPEPIVFETDPDEFGLYRTYTTFPSTDPEADQTLADISETPLGPQQPNSPPSSWWKDFRIAFHTVRENIYHPFRNATTFRLTNWFYSGSNTKTVAEMDSLVQDVLLKEDFNVNDLRDFSMARELQRLDTPDGEAIFPAEAGWKESSVYLRLPVNKEKPGEKNAPKFEVGGVWHRNLLEVL